MKLPRLFGVTKQIEVVRKSSSSLSLEEWRGERTLVSTAGKVWNDPDFQLMMQVMDNEHPAYVVFAPDTRPDMRMAHQAKCEGYTLALANLKAMRVLKQRIELESPEFAEEEIAIQQR